MTNKAKQPIENFFDDEVFYENLGDYLRYAFDVDEAAGLVDVPEAFTNRFQLTTERPMFQMDLYGLKILLCDRYILNLPEDFDEDIIDEALIKSVNFDKLNALIPKSWHPNGEFVTVTKQDLIDYFE